MIADTFDQLCAFAGTWQGEGRGRFPTIDDFRYEERLQLVADDAYPLLAYEQRTWLEDGEPGHWESGFWRPGPGGVVEISNAQESGRVEVLSGRVRQTDAGTKSC